MKILVKITLIIVIALITVGYYYKNNGDKFGDTLVGIAIISLAFVLMPLFLYSRYRDKK